MKRAGTGRAGFSLLELTVVLAVMNVLMASSLIVIGDRIETAKTKQCLSQKKQLQRSDLLFAVEYGRGSQSIAELIKSGYLNEDPKCPSKGIYVLAGSTGTAQSRVSVCSIHGWSGSAGGSALKDLLTILRGRWDVVDDMLYPTGAGTHTAFFKTSTEGGFELTATATVFSGTGHEVFYLSDGKTNVNGYSIRFAPASNRILTARLMKNGSQSKVFANVAAPNNYPLYNRIHTLSIQVKGGLHVIRVDGQVMTSFTDKTYTSGKPGLATGGNPKLAILSMGTQTL